MKLALIVFWAVMIFSSIAWYAALLFYVGYKGGTEIIRMAKDLRDRPHVANGEPQNG